MSTAHKPGKPKKWNGKRITGLALLIALMGSMAYAVIRLFTAPQLESEALPYSRLQSDYFMMLLQCIVGLAIMFIPQLLEKRTALEIPNYMYTLYYIFLFCAIYLGEIRDFFYLIPNWDTILHAFSGAMLGALGFVLVSVLNDSKMVKISLSPFFIALFALCFALAIGGLWEIIEYLIDDLLGVNMQKFALEDGTLLIGHQALRDTMEDLMVDFGSALVVVVLGFFALRRERKRQ